MPREPIQGSDRLAGAAVWAAYGSLEVATAIGFRRLSLPSFFVAPEDPFTLFLLCFYPLTGALLGRFAVVGLAAAFALNAVTAMTGQAVAVPVIGAVIAVAAFRRSPWTASLLLLLPVWAVREYGLAFSFWTKLLLAGAALFAGVLFGLVAWKKRWSVRPAFTLAIFAVTMLAATFIEVAEPRNLSPDAPSPRVALPNIVLIVMDTVRADHLSVYGYGRNTTPELARFAKTATVYTRAYAPSNMTLPSHASLFTGLYASEHTAHYDEGWAVGRPLPARALTIAELLAARGYATGSIAANGYLGDPFGLGQGFQHLDARPPAMPYGLSAEFYLRSGIAALGSRFIGSPRNARRLSRDGEEITDLAIAYLERVSAKQRPFFLVLNYLDAHHPYLPPAPYRTMFPGFDPTQPDDLTTRLMHDFATGNAKMTDRERTHLLSQYDGSIAYADRQISRVLGTLQRRGVYDDTLVVVLSDHGESFGEHDLVTHGLANYDPETHVPLIVKMPGQSTSTVVTQPVSLLDVWPLLSGIPHAPFAVITESFPMRGPGMKRPRRPGTAKIEGTLKTIVNVNGTVETYDLARDPGETRNLAPNADSRRMAAAIAVWRRSLRDVAPAEPARAVDPETLRRLRALGYMQ